MRVATGGAGPVLFAALLAAACTPGKPVVEGQPEILVTEIDVDILGHGPDADLGWRFDPGEPREITIVAAKYEPETAAITVSIKTGEAPSTTRSGPPQRMSGKLRLHYQWTPEKAWKLVRLENVSFKKLAKP